MKKPNLLTWLNQFQKFSQHQLDNLSPEELRAMFVGLGKALAADVAAEKGGKT